MGNAQGNLNNCRTSHAPPIFLRLTLHRCASRVFHLKPVLESDRSGDAPDQAHPDERGGILSRKSGHTKWQGNPRRCQGARMRKECKLREIGLLWAAMVLLPSPMPRLSLRCSDMRPAEIEHSGPSEPPATPQAAVGTPPLGTARLLRSLTTAMRVSLA